MSKSYSLVANYVKVRTLIVRANPTGAATLTGLGIYEDSTYAAFSATPKREYVFVN